MILRITAGCLSCPMRGTKMVERAGCWYWICTAKSEKGRIVLPADEVRRPKWCMLPITIEADDQRANLRR